MKPTPAIQHTLHALALAAFVFIPAAACAATRTKQNNTDNLNLASSWDTLPGIADIAQWTSTVTADNTTATLGADLSWAGIKIVNPGGLVTIDPGNTLTVGSSGIDLSSATQDLTLNCGLTLRGGKQSWKAASGRTLTVAGTFARTGNAVDFTNFNAAATLSGLANDTSGILGPWATTGSLTTLNYVTSTNGAISTYTGQTDGTAGSLANVTDPNVNYKFGAAATLTGPITANTLLFNGAASILDNAGNTLTLNGLLCPVANSLQIKGTGNLVIGATKELVVFWNKGQSRIDCPVVDNSGGDSAVTLNIASGANQVYLTANNTYKGGTTINGAGTAATIALDCNANSFGSGPITVNTYELRLVSNGTLTNSITLNGGALRGHSAYSTVFSGPITLNSACYFYTSGTTTISGDMSGSGSFTLTPIGTGTTGTISGNNTYAGDTTVAANNTLKLGSNFAVPSGSGKGNVTVTGTLDLNAYSPVVNGLSGAGTVDNKVGGAPLLTVGDNDQTTTFSGVIKNTAGTLSLCKIGSGTLTLSGTNTYGGNTALSAGTLSLSSTVAGGCLADGADVYLTTGAVSDLNTSGAMDTIRSLYIDGVPQAAGVWGADGSGTEYTSTLITGTGKLNVTTLGSASTYSISGTVTENGAGLAGVTVTDGTRTSDPTGADGVYTIANVPDGITYTVTPSKSGYTFTPVNLSLMLSGANQTGNNFTATVSGTTYAGWAAAQVPPVTGGVNGDSNNDGVQNGIAYFMKDAGLITHPGLAGNAVTWPNGGNIPSTEYGADKQFVVQTSTDLVNWTPVAIGDLTTNTSGPGGALTYTLLEGVEGGKVFVRLVVTPN